MIKPDRRHTSTIFKELTALVCSLVESDDQSDLEDAVWLLLGLAKDSPALNSKRQEMLAILASHEHNRRWAERAKRYCAEVDQAIAERAAAGTVLH